MLKINYVLKSQDKTNLTGSCVYSRSRSMDVLIHSINYSCNHGVATA